MQNHHDDNIIPSMTMSPEESPSSESGNNNSNGGIILGEGEGIEGPPPDDIITAEIENLRRQLELLEQKRLQPPSTEENDTSETDGLSGDYREGYSNDASSFKEKGKYYESSGDEGDNIFTYEVEGETPTSRSASRGGPMSQYSSHSRRSRGSRGSRRLSRSERTGRSIGKRRSYDSEFESDDDDDEYGFDDDNSSTGRLGGETGSIGGIFGDSDDDIDITSHSNESNNIMKDHNGNIVGEHNKQSNKNNNKSGGGDEHINSYITLKTVHNQEELRIITKHEEEVFKDEHPIEEPLHYPPIGPPTTGGAPSRTSKTSASEAASPSLGKNKRTMARRRSTAVATIGGSSLDDDEEEQDRRNGYPAHGDENTDNNNNKTNEENKRRDYGADDENDASDHDDGYGTNIGAKASPLDNVQSALPETNPLLRSLMARHDSARSLISTSTQKGGESGGSASAYTAVSYEIKSRKGGGGSSIKANTEASYKRKGGKMRYRKTSARLSHSEDDESSISSSEDHPPPTTHMSTSLSSNTNAGSSTQQQRHHDAPPPDSIRNMFIDTSGMEKVTSSRTISNKDRSSVSTSHRSLSRYNNKSQYSSILPVKIIVDKESHNRSMMMAEATSVVSADWELDADRHNYAIRRGVVGSAIDEEGEDDDEEEEDETDETAATDDTGLSTPPFRQFTVIQLKADILNKLSDEDLFIDEGPRYLDSYCLSISPKHQLQQQQQQQHENNQRVNGNIQKEHDGFGICFQQYPGAVRPDFLDNQSLSIFCLPSGLRLRFIPRSANDGAHRIGWIGKAGDKSHVLVFTDGSGLAHHGVCITVREEYVPSSKGEKSKLVHAMKSRQRRRYAASIISRWWKQFVQYRILTNALHIAGFENFTAWDLKAELSPTEMQLLERSLKHCPLAGKDVFGSTNTSSIMRSSTNSKAKNVDLHKKMNKQGIRRKVRKILSRDKSNDNSKMPTNQSGNNKVDGQISPSSTDFSSHHESSHHVSEHMSREEVNAVETVTRNAILRSPSMRNGVITDSRSTSNNTNTRSNTTKTKTINKESSPRRGIDNNSSSSRRSTRMSKYKLLDDTAYNAGDNITNNVDDVVLDTQLDTSETKKKSGGLLRVLERADARSFKKGKKSSTSKSVSSSSRKSRRSLGLRSLPAVSGGNGAADEGDGVDDDNRSTLSDFLNRKKQYVKQSTRYGSVKTELTPISDNTPPVDNKDTTKYSKKVRRLGLESYQTMKAADKLGYMCIVEKCYVLIGCRPDHYSLLLCTLQQLVDNERDDWIRRLRQIRNQRRRGHGESSFRAEEKLKVDLENNRHLMVESMLDRVRLSNKQSHVTFPSCQLDYIQGRTRFFRTRLPFLDAEPIKLPLPLPNIGRQWGVAKLLLTIGSDSLVLALKLLLLERSMIVLGENLEEVTSCACALLELLKPFEWASAFMPVLPVSMLDFVHSPVPFIAGVAVNHRHNMIEVENDERVIQAMSQGLSIINLASSTLLLTTETGVSQMLSLDPYLREQLTFLNERLQHYVKDESSAVKSFPTFVKNGLSKKESLTLNSVTSVLEKHFQSYCGDLATSTTAWKRYGTIDVKSGNFVFYPAWFMNPIRADQFFHEAIVHTQLFMGYVDDRRTDQMDLAEIKKGEIGIFIANWIYKKWIAKKERYFNKFVLEGNETTQAPSDRISSNLTTSVLTG